ncbi:MAG: GNAT family N-acetyltransferase [Elusimicrobia bacterium]|nr:GNAT family N-acetyltransferase [Elusimicrobiota bacterium]
MKKTAPAKAAKPSKAAARLVSGPHVELAEPEDLDDVRAMFREYAQGIGAFHCLDGFEEEACGLPGDYAAPKGRLLIARVGRKAAGCAGVRPLQGGACEMKRLYVRPAFRGKGLGRALVERALAEAKRAGYRRVQLDTLPNMREALMLYAVLGFTSVEPYLPNPTPGALCFEKAL